MAFRADEAAERGYAETKNYLIPRGLTAAQREQAERVFHEVVSKCGPPIDAYPCWHPLVSQHNRRHPETYPNDRCGYEGLDHTRYFAHGFVTCPYGDGQKVIDSASKIDCGEIAYITAEALDVTFYNSSTTAILVRCDWSRDLEPNHMIPKALAVPLMLEYELPAWRWAQVAETWENMRPYLLGRPHGSRSSLFVSQDTALAMKKVYVAMIESGMYGPIYS